MGTRRVLLMAFAFPWLIGVSALAQGPTYGVGRTPTAEEIRGFCQGQIAHYKVPRYVKFVDGFPMTVTGKIQKFLMRQHMIEELGLSVWETA